MAASRTRSPSQDSEFGCVCVCFRRLFLTPLVLQRKPARRRELDGGALESADVARRLPARPGRRQGAERACRGGDARLQGARQHRRRRQRQLVTSAPCAWSRGGAVWCRVPANPVAVRPAAAARRPSRRRCNGTAGRWVCHAQPLASPSELSSFTRALHNLVRFPVWSVVLSSLNLYKDRFLVSMYYVVSTVHVQYLPLYSKL